MESRQQARRSTNRTMNPVTSPMTTPHNTTLVAQDNLLMEAEVSSEEEPLLPTIADLHSITDENQMAKLFDALDQKNRDGGDSDEEVEECEFHNEAITKSMLSRYTHKDNLTHTRMPRPET